MYLTFWFNVDTRKAIHTRVHSYYAHECKVIENPYYIILNSYLFLFTYSVLLLFFFFVLRISLWKFRTKQSFTQWTVYMGHIRPFIYHFVSIVRIYYIIYSRDWTSAAEFKKFITVTS